MIRKMARIGGLIALMLPLVFTGAVLAGTDCYKGGKADTAARAGAGKGSHCHLGLTRNIVKTARMTDDGAVVTFTGRTPEAVDFLKAHLGRHEKGEGCPDCPLAMADVDTTVKLTEDGGEVTLVGADEETIRKVQTWAAKPAACCEKSQHA